MADNLFGRNYVRQLDPSQASVFISHSRKDKAAARLVANAILAMSIHVYFDEQDECLRQNESGPVGVVRCIDNGLTASSHLLGIITKSTKDSWWVPYEIGGASGQKKPCAHLVASDVDSLPAYIAAGNVLLDQDDLAEWASNIKGITRDYLFENLRKSATYGSASGIDSVLPTYRLKSNVRFY